MSELPIELRLNNDPIEQGERIVAAYPKTGRTWLRFLIANYLVENTEFRVEVDFKNVYTVIPNTDSGRVPGQPEFMYYGLLPKVTFTHETANPAKPYPEETIYITRHPRDVMVSNWFHRTRQLQTYEGPLSEFIRDSSWGIESFLQHVEGWRPVVEAGKLLTYEALKADTSGALETTCRMLGLPIDRGNINRAVDMSTFQRMQKIEEQTIVAGHSYDTHDPGARRVRSGKIGGYRDHMSADDLRYITRSLRHGSAFVQKLFPIKD